MNLTVSYPFQLSQQDIDYSDSLEQSDLGTWVLLVNGCYQFFESEQSALNARKELLR